MSSPVGTGRCRRPDRADELHFFEPSRLEDCLDVSLQRVTKTLQAAERKLQRHRRALVRVARDVDEPLGIVATSAAMRQLMELTRRSRTRWSARSRSRAEAVELEDLPEEIRRALPETVASGAVRPLDEIEKEYIVAALALNEGNQTRTAQQLHIGSATLYRKLKSYGLIGSARTPSSGRRRDSV